MLFSIALKARHLAATHHGFHGAADFVHFHAHRRGFVAINPHFQLRFVQLQIRIGVHQSRLRVARFSHHLIAVFRQFFIGRRLNHVAHRQVAKTLAQRRRIDGKSQHPGQRHELRKQFAGNLRGLFRALTPRLHHVERHGDIHRIWFLQAGRHDHEAGINFRHILKNFFDRQRILIGVGECGTFRRQSIGHEPGAILLRR